MDGVPKVMIERGEGFTKGFAFGAIMLGARLVGGVVSAYLADRKLGQRYTVMFGMIAALIVPLFNVSFINMLGVEALGFFVIGAQGILNNLGAPPQVTRSTAAGSTFDQDRPPR